MSKPASTIARLATLPSSYDEHADPEEVITAEVHRDTWRAGLAHIGADNAVPDDVANARAGEPNSELA